MRADVVRGLVVLCCELLVVTYNLIGDSKSRTHTSSVRTHYSKKLDLPFHRIEGDDEKTAFLLG
jgi:hypothetical protein